MAIHIQTKKQAEVIIKDLTKKYQNAQLNTALGKWEMAKILHTLDTAVAWKVTKYKSFVNYAENVLFIGYPTMRGYIQKYNLLHELGYTKVELIKLSKIISFSALAVIFSTLNKKETVAYILNKHKENVLNSRNNYGKNNKAIGNCYYFILKDRQMHKLNKKLEKFGMKILKNNSKKNLSIAMNDFIDSL